MTLRSEIIQLTITFLCLLGLVALVFIQNPDSLSPAGTVGLEEDITDPSIKAAFLAKFTTAKDHHKHVKIDVKKLTAAQKAKIAAQMRALRKQIEGDFARNSVFEQRADCSYPYPAASCKGHQKRPPRSKIHFMDPPPFSVG